MNDKLDALLKHVPEPAPPPAFKAAVMARIAREADRQSDVTAAARARRRESPAWLWTVVAGLTIVIGASLYGWLGAGALPNVTAPLIGGGQVDLVPMEAPVALMIGLGILVYLGGLFAPLSRRVTHQPRRTD